MLKSLGEDGREQKIEAAVALMEQAAFSAAQHMLQTFNFQRSLAATRKEDTSVLTVLDIESQEIVRGILGRSITVIAEEDPSTHSLTGEKEYFLVDPLDGTSACKRFPGVVGGQVGYGPLLGYALDRRLIACVYVNIPTRKLYTAVRGLGTYEISLERWSRVRLADRRRIICEEQRPLIESAALFYPGLNGEIRALENLRTRLEFETTYRFGGFANDCTRLALGYEQIGIQFSLKVWDLSAALLPAEAGLRVIVDPLGSRVELADFPLVPQCAVLISQRHFSDDVLEAIRL